MNKNWFIVSLPKHETNGLLILTLEIHIQWEFQEILIHIHFIVSMIINLIITMHGN